MRGTYYCSGLIHSEIVIVCYCGSTLQGGRIICVMIVITTTVSLKLNRAKKSVEILSVLWSDIQWSQVLV